MGFIIGDYQNRKQRRALEIGRASQRLNSDSRMKVMLAPIRGGE